MNAKIKIAAYAVLVILVIWFGWGFYSTYSIVSHESADTPPPAETAPVSTNNAVDTSSNALAGGTNQTNIAIPPPTPAAPAPPAHSVHGKMIGYLAAFVGAIIGLGILVAHDVTQIVGSAAVDALLDDKGEGMRDPEYERGEQLWANGKHLEAIQVMREFLKNHPREQYAALRIAEIYEKDLRNFLAAALEYEEVLKQKLPPERWGWAAIHLCNLYSKLGQQEKTRALLQRIVDDYPKTSAAKKARARLGLPEPEAEPVAKDTTRPAGEPTQEILQASVKPAEAEAEPEPPPPPPPPKSNLPPGFRPKT